VRSKLAGMKVWLMCTVGSVVNVTIILRDA
jgi:hypothetical protein